MSELFTSGSVGGMGRKLPVSTRRREARSDPMQTLVVFAYLPRFGMLIDEL